MEAAKFRAVSMLIVGYLLCVLAPTLSLAAGHVVGSACGALAGNHHYTSAVQVDTDVQNFTHRHVDGSSHEHDQIPDNKKDKKSASLCCGTLCITALPASIGRVANPDHPSIRTFSVNQEQLTGSEPEQVDRPPIFLLSL